MAIDTPNKNKTITPHFASPGPETKRITKNYRKNMDNASLSLDDKETRKLGYMQLHIKRKMVDNGYAEKMGAPNYGNSIFAKVGGGVSKKERDNSDGFVNLKNRVFEGGTLPMISMSNDRNGLGQRNFKDFS